MSPHWNDILIWCDACGDGPDCPVKLYRWISGQGTWVPIDGSNRTITYLLPGDRKTASVDDLLIPAREVHAITCDSCRQHVDARAGGLQIVLTKLAAAGIPDISLSGFRRAYGSLPEQAR